MILLAHTCLTYLRARAAVTLREQRGEVSMRTVIGVLLVFVAWKLFPDTFTGFFKFVHDMLFNGLDQAGKDGQVHGPAGTNSPPGGGTVGHTTTTTSHK